LKHWDHIKPGDVTEKYIYHLMQWVEDET
jgi:hypothetical protein